MKNNLRNISLLLMAFIGMTVMAAVPSGYYNNAKNKSDQALMTALHTLCTKSSGVTLNVAMTS